eukprot:360003-Chlamydomonas_euryale.AAC.2
MPVPPRRLARAQCPCSLGGQTDQKGLPGQAYPTCTEDRGQRATYPWYGQGLTLIGFQALGFRVQGLMVPAQDRVGLDGAGQGLVS